MSAIIKAALFAFFKRATVAFLSEKALIKLAVLLLKKYAEKTADTSDDEWTNYIAEALGELPPFELSITAEQRAKSGLQSAVAGMRSANK